MGKYDNAMYLYLSDNDRFADLFNAVFFDGEKVLWGDMLEPDAERHSAVIPQENEKYGTVPSRNAKNCMATVPEGTWRTKADAKEHMPHIDNGFRDIKKRLRTGEGFVVMAVENQNDIDYIMPWRIMRLDQMEYGRQINEIQKRKQAERNARGLPRSRWAERLGKEDKIAPIYTLCFYHGIEKWDGPRSLKDMMRFDEENAIWKRHFHDYDMSLFCANEPIDLTRFNTELKQLLAVLPLRQDKKALSELWSKEEFSHLDRETIETMAIVTDSTEILDKLEEYKEEGGYNMCRAVEEMRRDWKAEGKTEAILQILSLYGEIPEAVRQKIFSERNQDVVDKWIKTAAQAGSLENFLSEEGIVMG